MSSRRSTTASNEQPLEPVWISVVPREKALLRARRLERDPVGPVRPLYGVPFAVKDNIDLAGLPTTAGCPAYAYSPARSATVVQALVDAGAIPIGKTNMDQFATGLVGTRSPHGACSSVFDARYISGGSSSGSAVAVASGLASFALGTDTAGSGRVPAAFNGLVGLKPTRGVLSTQGVVPACRTLDCVSILSWTCDDAHTVWNAARGFDADDRFSRLPRRRRGCRAVAGRRIPLRRAVREPARILRRRCRRRAVRPGGGAHGGAGRAQGRNRFLDLPRRRRPALLGAVGRRALRRDPPLYRSACGRDEPGGARHHRRRAALLGGGRVRGRIPAARTAPRRGSPVGAAWTSCCCPPPAPSTRTKRWPRLRCSSIPISATTRISSTCWIWRRSRCRRACAPTDCRSASR